MRSLFTACLACAVFAFAAVPRPAAADDTLTIMQASVALSVYDVLDVVAERAGFFKSEHLIVNEQSVNSPSAAAQLVATGKGDLCALSAEAVIQGYVRGLHLQYFLAHDGRYSNVLAVLDGSPIRTREDFRGKNIGVINIGSAGEVTAQVILAGAGIAKNDVTYTPIGVGAQALEAMVDKRVDAVGFPYVALVPLEIVGHVTMRVFRDPILNDIANAGYAAAPATIRTRGPVLARFARAIVKAALFVRYNPHVSAAYFMQAEGTRITPQSLADKTRAFALVEDDLPAANPADKRIGSMSPRSLEVLSRVLTDYGLTSQVVPGNEITTDQFIGYANDFDHRQVIALAQRMHVTNTGEVVP
jgi:NitT/TauT family transport system substrate-binding protein